MKAVTTADIFDWIQSTFGYLAVDHTPAVGNHEVPLQPRTSRRAARKHLRRHSRTPYQRLFGSQGLNPVLQLMAGTSPRLFRKIQVGFSRYGQSEPRERTLRAKPCNSLPSIFRSASHLAGVEDTQATCAIAFLLCPRHVNTWEDMVTISANALVRIDAYTDDRLAPMTRHTLPIGPC